ncbi:MAG: VOC family protein [Methylocystis sp.]
MFSRAMSAMYKSEVPQYRALAELVARLNRDALNADREIEGKRRGELEQLGMERHGAIRLGTPEELSTIRRLFMVMGMVPVGYYDLSVSGIPVHSTAFRPTSEEALRRNPFRVFTSLLRLDLIEDEEVRRAAAAALARRNIFTPRCMELIEQFEANGEFDETRAREFVATAVETFRWRGAATVPAKVYRKLHSAHPLVADVACFDGPHINHLTLAALDIDAAQQALAASEMNPKAIIEGPPRRRCPILLRQTSFKALPEPVVFPNATGAPLVGVHTARFGEIEQRGVALTAKGRALYDWLLAAAHAHVPIAGDASNAVAHMEELRRCFEAFPDDAETLCVERLAFFRYSPTAGGAKRTAEGQGPFSVEGLLRAGLLRIEPIVYEDFLPVSAAGIFRSNLDATGRGKFTERSNRGAFEEALGAVVLDETALYQEVEAASLDASLRALGLRGASALGSNAPINE